jgi:hypothetical protein
MISGRRTYADLFLNFSADEDVRNTYLYFYDFNLKTNYKLNNRNRIYLSGYLGRDDFGYKNEFGFDWGSNYRYVPLESYLQRTLFSNTSLIFSNYSYDINVMTSFDAIIRSEIRDLNLKQDFSLVCRFKQYSKFGANVISHTILPGEVTLNEGNGTLFHPTIFPGERPLNGQHMSPIRAAIDNQSKFILWPSPCNVQQYWSGRILRIHANGRTGFKPSRQKKGNFLKPREA